MKLRFKLTSLLVIALGILTLAVPSIAHAQEVRSSDNVVVDKNETINSSLATTGSTINIEGTVDGDLYCLGSQVIISGQIKGDVFCMAQSISINGRVDGSARLFASDMNISGSIDGSLSALSSNFILTDKGKVGQDLMLASSDARLSGSVGRDISIYSQSTELNGYVGRNVSGNISKLTLGSSSDIRGDLKYTSNNEPIRLSGSKLSGQLVRSAEMSQPSKQSGLATLLIGYLISTLSLLIVSMLSVWAMPKFFASTLKEIEGSIGKASLYGLANIFIVPVICIGLLFTIVGIPLAGLIFVAWLLSLILCGPVFAYYAGTKLLKGRKSAKNEYLVMLTGSVLILVLYLIPIVNFITGIVVGLVGSGAILAHFKHLNARKK